MPTDLNESAKKLVVGARVFGVFGYAILILGLAMAIGDISIAVKSPISSLSTATTFFGLFAVIMSELLARRAEKWAAQTTK